MRFQPSVYSDVAAVAPAPAPATPLSNVATAATALSEIVGAGTAAWDAASAAKMAKWQQKAAKKKAKKRRAATPTPTAATPAAVLAPAAKPPTDWAKWGLIGMGVLVAGIVTYLVLRPSPDAEKDKTKKNPAKTPKPAQRGAFVRTLPRRRVPKVIDVEAEVVEDDTEPTDEEDDAAFAGTEEEEE